MISKIRNHLKIKVNSSSIFEKFIKLKKAFYFVQIGGFDGVRFDGLFNYFERIEPIGYIIEPVNEYFEKLSLNTQRFNKIILVNKAIHNTLKSTQIYKIKKSCLNNYPDWIEGCASFYKNNILKHGVNESCIETTNVYCININEVFQKFSFNNELDYFQIDSEGYDGQIILDVNFKLFKPTIIKFEYVNLDIKELMKVKNKLKRNGYILTSEGNDYLAIRYFFFLKLILF